MRKIKLTILTLFLSLLSSPSWSETLTIDDLVEREGIFYKKFTIVPFTGEVFGKKSGKFNKGKPDGQWVHYYSSGHPKEIKNYKDGKLDGFWGKYSHGKLWGKGNFKDGKQDGLWEEYWSNGQLNTKKYFNDSGQDTFINLLSGQYTPHFFGRYVSKNPEFVYLGVGAIINFKYNVHTQHSKTICLTLSVLDAQDIIASSLPELQIETPSEQLIKKQPSSFVLEKHLEDYLCRNWSETIFGKKYDIYKNGRQYQTDTGPLDILAQRKDKSEFMVLELKRDRVSDNAVSQTLRYINFVRRTLATNGEEVKGCIIGTEEDRALMNTIAEVPNIDFYRYNISFSLDLVKS